MTGRVGTTGLCVPVSRVRPVMNESMSGATISPDIVSGNSVAARICANSALK